MTAAVLVDQRTAVYRFFDADDNLLYVGITNDLGVRWSRHESVAPWWAIADHMTVQWYPNRAEALEVEGIAVRSEDAVHNVMGRGHTPRRTVRVEPPVWEAFGQFTAARDRDRAGLLRDFIRFCIEHPDEAGRLIEQWRDSARQED